MLLEFRVKNFKSFNEEAVFSMIPAKKQKGLDYSVCTENINGKKCKGLSTSVVYGPNAAGKTNIIGAMEVLRAIILRGNIRNSNEEISPNAATSTLELIPNNKSKEVQPVEFVIEFVEKSIKFKYVLKIDLGDFLNSDYKRRVLMEALVVNGKKIFNRTNELTIGDLKGIDTNLSDSFSESILSLKKIAKTSLNEEELFLTNGFKLMFSQDLTKLITDWFTNKFMVVYHADSMQLIKRFADPQKKAVYIEKTTDKAAKLFGINSNAIGYIIGDDDSEAKLCSIFKEENKKKAAAMSAELFESYGTVRFINMFPLVIKAIMTGATLIVDEFDASIHPMALMSIINIFHNDDINTRHAQLIFNTHNPIFLNHNLFRRDEIKFVERNDDSNCSTLYALSDFGTSGENGVRQHEDYMKNYFVSRYGAIKDIDFTPIFEEILADEGEV